MRAVKALGSLGIICLAALAPVGCASDLAEEMPADHCNPLTLDHCLLPWPSSAYLRADPSTATGYRLAMPQAALPRNVDGKRLDPARLNVLDGFSVGAQILVHFRQGVDRRGLPGQDALESSLSAESTVQLVAYKSGQRVPLFAEPDVTVEPGQPATLIIRPQQPLDFNTRYIVALRQGLLGLDGVALQSPAPFARLRDGRSTANPRLEAMREGTDQLLERLEQLGLPRSEVLLAWDFVTASHEAVVGRMQGLLARADAQMPQGQAALVDMEAEPAPAPLASNLLRQISGTMLVPSFLTEDGAGQFDLGDDGQPRFQKLQPVPFYVAIPQCAQQASAPLPVLLYGHGLFGTPNGEMLSEYQSALEQRLCVVGVATAWNGINLADVPTFTNRVLSDFTNMSIITDRLQQSHVNWHVLIRLLQGALASHPAMQVQGHPVTDGAQQYYFGLSGGGTQTGALAALNPEVSRVVLHVSGGWFSLILQRTAAFWALGRLLEAYYPDPVDRLIVISLSQQLWDYTDMTTYARHLVRDPLDGSAPRRVLIQEARNDELMPNLATRAVARGVGLPALAPQVEPTFGITAQPGPLPSAYTQWDTRSDAIPPSGNEPAPLLPKDRSPHYQLRTLPQYFEQLEAFLRPDGQVVQTCDGSCDPG